MNRRYTHDFPASESERAEPASPLEGLSFVFYACRHATGLGDWNYPAVLSPYWRLLHCPRGTGTVVHGRRRYVLNRRNLILIPAEVETTFSSAHPLDMVYAHFVPVFPLAIEALMRFDQPVEVGLQDGHRFLIRMLTAPTARHGPRSTDLLRFRALLDLCFAAILEPSVDRLWAHAPADARVARMLDLIQRRYAEPLTNAQFARAVGLGPDQAVRLFRGATGLTPQARLRRVRLEEAARMLAATDLSIKQIAAGCGFANRFHFTRLFSGKTGVGPAAFRRRFRVGQSGSP